MRTLKFRDVLWGIAYKLSLDPQQSNFQTNQAIPIGTYIDQYMRRAWDAKDFPEWTVTHQFIPNNSHIVTWDSIAQDLIPNSGPNGAMVQIGQVLKVYLVNPKTNDAPVDTRFEELAEGIHCGFGHGTYVWIEYMKPAPRFTAETWMAGRTFQKDDPTYSYTTGDCYRSKGNDNLNNDPALSFNPPPPTVNLAQTYLPPSPGIPQQDQIVEIHINEFLDPHFSVGTFPNPEVGTFYIQIGDENGTGIGTAVHTCTVGDTLASITTDLATQLDGVLPIHFTVDQDTTLFTITLTDATAFQVLQAYYSPTDPVTQTYRMKVFQLQAFIPETPPFAGQPQINNIAFNSETTFPGALYTLNVLTQDGITHSVAYQSVVTDSAVQIMLGLAAAITVTGAADGGDPWWQGVVVVLNTIDKIMDLYINEKANVYVVTTVDGSPWWELVPFPRAIANEVIRGGYADLLKEWGQSDKGALEEQMLPAEQQIVEDKFTTTPNPPLTGQQRALSRYRQ